MLMDVAIAWLPPFVAYSDEQREIAVKLLGGEVRL
jgi:hypothetical protein